MGDGGQAQPRPFEKITVMLQMEMYATLLSAQEWRGVRTKQQHNTKLIDMQRPLDTA